jgi:hypothetical protein
MPFTPSHAVVALPFLRTPLAPAAIAVGAMAPDLPLFVRGLPLHYGRTHDLLWLPATVLLALGLLLVWRCALRPAARELSPRWLAARLPESWDDTAGAAARETLAVRRRGGAGSLVSGRGMMLLVVSLLLGVVSHIVWDLFTHAGRWGVTVLPALQEQWGPYEGFRWLQHGSSVLGLAIIGVWAIAWLRRRPNGGPVTRVLPGWTRGAWWLSLPVILAVAWVLGVWTLGPLDEDFTVAHLAYRVLPPACALWGALTLALCAVVQVRMRSAAVAPARWPGGGR